MSVLKNKILLFGFRRFPAVSLYEICGISLNKKNVRLCNN